MLKTKIKEKKRKIEFTERERNIIQCIASGYTSTDIALDMQVSISVIHSDMAKMFQKTGTLNRAHLVAWAYQNKIL